MPRKQGPRGDTECPPTAAAPNYLGAATSTPPLPGKKASHYASLGKTRRSQTSGTLRLTPSWRDATTPTLPLGKKPDRHAHVPVPTAMAMDTGMVPDDAGADDGHTGGHGEAKEEDTSAGTGEAKEDDTSCGTYDWMDDNPAIDAIFNRPTAMSSFVSEVADLPDLGDAQGLIVWKNTIQKHARKAATELSQFQTDLETCLRSVDELVLACAAIKNAAQYKLEGLKKLESIAASNSADIAANFAGMATLMLMINGLAETAKLHSSRLTAQDAAIASIAQAQPDLPQIVMKESLLAVDTSLTKHMTQVLAVVDGHLLCWGLYNILDWTRKRVSVSDTETCFRVGHGFPCRDFDRYVSTYENWIQVEAVSSNQIFVWAMIFPCFYTP